VGPAADAPREHPADLVRVVRIETVDEVDPGDLTDDDAARAGVRSLAELHRLLDRRDGAHVYRMQ
jgi:hypothetical protein